MGRERMLPKHRSGHVKYPEQAIIASTDRPLPLAEEAKRVPIRHVPLTKKSNEHFIPQKPSGRLPSSRSPVRCAPVPGSGPQNASELRFS